MASYSGAFTRKATLMREERDCHVAVIATACQVSYEEAAKALNHIKLGGLESPVFSNPWNLYRALIKLGFWKKNITWHDIEHGNAKPDETIMLVKNSFLEQHWVVWSGTEKHIVDGAEKVFHRLYWGDSVEPVLMTSERLLEMFTTSFPNCAFQVYNANFWSLLWARILSLFGKF